MYRQILIKPEERKFQRIFWRSDFNSPMKIYELNTITYGTASAAYLATRCLVQLGIENKDKYPLASQALLHDFYVDDLLTGVNSIEEGIKLKRDISEILLSAGMELRKWASNEPKIIQGQANVNNKTISIHGDKDPKTLGLLWDPSNDKLKYRVNFSDTRKITKRTILSLIAQIFDPLGLVGPAIIQAKIIMQRLWSLQLDWDETVPQELHHAWTTTYEQLNDINKIIVDRHVTIKNCKEIEFHGFCDASEVAYGACIYVCSTNEAGKRTSHLLCAKSRVAPLKATSIPRLELLGAVLLAQLAHKVSLAWNLQRKQWFFWSDSMVALAWIKSPSNKWKPFVANRVAEIQDLTSKNWNHVESAMNPADLISRGVNAQELSESSLWWHGPSWLIREHTHWPTNQRVSLESLPEQKNIAKTFLTQLNAEKTDTSKSSRLPSPNIIINFERFSSFTKLTRTVACVMRYINNIKMKVALKKASLSSKIDNNQKPNSIAFSGQELQHATYMIIKWAQSESFVTEIADLQKNKALTKNSKLLQLTPFLDKDGLLRVGGRLKNTNLPFDNKHPMILSPSHRISHLLIKYEHLRLLHAGCQAVLASLRTNYWILNGKNAVKKVLHECITCYRAKPIGQTCLMGDMPALRLMPTRPFLNCGVDYAGPFLIKEKTRSKISIKAYICIFVCFVTKAVHIELATDLSTDAFLNCLKRFVSRRGLCQNIYSDNGTNFIGAKNALNELGKLIADKNFRDRIINFASMEKITWHFIPPRAPHFGGLWESAVKSAKYHLKRVIGETRLTFEELYTVLAQVEACMNSRPLSPLSNDPNDLTPLTPAHFLIGDTLKALPQANVSEIKDNRLNRYEHLQKILQHFWNRWQKEYLPQLQTRQKWTSSPPAIEKDTMVIIKEDNLPPLHWPLGRVILTHPGKDGHVRVVSIKTAKGVIKRPISKICVLPIPKNQTDDLNNPGQQQKP